MKLHEYTSILNRITGKSIDPEAVRHAYLSLCAVQRSSHEKIIISYNAPHIMNQLVLFSNIRVLLPQEKFNIESPTPANLTLLLVNDGTERMGIAPSEAKKKGSFRGLDILEGLWLITYHPEILKHHSIDLIEGLYGLECIPTIYSWDNAVNMSAICPDVSDKMCGAPYVIQEVSVPGV